MTKKEKYFSGKICWITGGGSGIGRALAISLSYLGCKVYISSRNRGILKQVSALHPEIYSLPLDVTSKESWLQAADLIKQEHGSLDLMIFNAGQCLYLDDFNELDTEACRRIMDVNFMGIVLGLETVLPLLSSSPAGHIAAVTSSVARLPLSRAELYGSSKAAATYFLNSLRLDLAQSNIDVSVILPGFVQTPMTDKNDFPMPFIISSEKAAKSIVKGLYRRRREIYFPSPFTWPLRVLSVLPMFLQQKITRYFS